MIKFLYRSLILLLIIIFSSIIYLSLFGFKTDKFNDLIQDKANEVNRHVKLEFKETKIHLDIRKLKLLIRLKEPKIIVKKNKIDLSKLDLLLSLRSFYTSDFLLEKGTVAFEKNDIKDLVKITNIFLPTIINNQLNKIFAKGSLEGEFIIPFTRNGNVSKKYKFNGKVLEADINITKDYKLKKLSAEVKYGEDTLPDVLRIIVKKGSLLSLEIMESFIDIEFRENSKSIQSSIHTKGNINNSQVNNFFSIIGVKKNNLKNINLTSDLTTSANLVIDKKFKINQLAYSTKGTIINLQLVLDKKKIVKEFLPNFSPDITFKNAKLDFVRLKDGNQNLIIDGDVKFGDEFEKVEIKQSYNSKNKKYNINGSSTLNTTPLNIANLNYKKEKNEKAQVNFNIDFVKNEYFFINSLDYSSNESKIKLNKIKLNKKVEIIDLESLSIKTYLKKIKNNDFTIIKTKFFLVEGNVFDARPILNSLYKKNSKKIFSSKFNNKLKINFKKTLTATNDDLSDLSMIASVKNGSYEKLNLKGNFSENEIMEISIYQINKDKKTFQLISDRARPFIKNFDFIKGFKGGKLQYETVTTKSESKSNLIITDFKVSKVPLLTKLLTLASLRGIADTLSGEGIRFKVFEMKSNTVGNILNIEEAIAIGPAISILLNGYVDKGKIVSLSGTLVPATKLNSLIASIPIVGDILVGKKTGEGVVGVSFKMKGPPKNIKTTVNPIKTLTPRFIIRAIEKMKEQKKEEIK